MGAPVGRSNPIVFVVGPCTMISLDSAARAPALKAAIAMVANAACRLAFRILAGVEIVMAVSVERFGTFITGHRMRVRVEPDDFQMTRACFSCHDRRARGSSVR